MVRTFAAVACRLLDSRFHEVVLLQSLDLFACRNADRRGRAVTCRASRRSHRTACFFFIVRLPVTPIAESRRDVPRLASFVPNFLLRLPILRRRVDSYVLLRCVPVTFFFAATSRNSSRLCFTSPNSTTLPPVVSTSRNTISSLGCLPKLDLCCRDTVTSPIDYGRRGYRGYDVTDACRLERTFRRHWSNYTRLRQALLYPTFITYIDNSIYIYTDLVQSIKRTIYWIISHACVNT